MFLAIVFKVLCRQFSRSWLSTYITCLNSTWLVYTAFTYCPCVYLKAKSSTTPSANLFLSGANSSLYATHLPPFPFLSLSLSLSLSLRFRSNSRPPRLFARWRFDCIKRSSACLISLLSSRLYKTALLHRHPRIHKVWSPLAHPPSSY